jgi:hypothetical protein
MMNSEDAQAIPDVARRALRPATFLQAFRDRWTSLVFASVTVHDRHVLLAYATSVVIAVVWYRVSVASIFASATAANPLDLMGIGAGELLAVIALFSIIQRVGDDALLTRRDLLVLASSSIAFVIPTLVAACIPITIAALLFLPRRDKRLASLGQLFLALASYELLGRVLFTLVSPYVLSAETTAVYALLSAFGDYTRENLTIFSSDGHGISIEIPCSAFHNLTLAALVWISLTKLETLELTRAHLRVFAVMAGTTIALNVVRIALMAQSYSMYVYWHHGPGVMIVSIVMFVALLAVFFMMRPAAVRA